MDSALAPREIQERVRAGQSVAEVAEAAGVPPEKIAPFTDPVLVERRYVADTAVSSSVRRQSDTDVHTTLRLAVSHRLMDTGLDMDAVSWDAIRYEDRFMWTIIARWEYDGEQHTGHFRYDVKGRYSIAQDDDARWLVDDHEPEPEPEPAHEESPDNEPTVNFAEQFGDSPADEEYEPVDINDLVPSPESELDNLYAMLHGFEEDSVNVYAGLSEPPTPEQVAAGEVPDEQPPTETEYGEQPTLLGDEPIDKTPPRKSRKRRRASVPSWDEIMFGGKKD